MKAISVLLFTIALSVAFANTALFQSLAEIDQDPFGSAIISAISLNLRAKAPVQEVADLLQQILDDLLADQRNLNTNYKNQKADLEAAITNGQSLIDSYSRSITSLEQSIESDTAARATKQTTLANTRNAQTYEEKRLSDLIAAYQAYVPNADADISDLNRASQSITTAIDRMNSFRSSNVGAVALLEISSSTQKDMKRVADAVERMKKTLSKRSNLYIPLVSELLELTSNMEQSNADRVISLLRQLNDLLTQASRDVQTQRAAFIDDNTRNQREATTNIDNYKTQIARLETDIKNLDQRIDKANADLQIYKNLRTAAQQKLAEDKAKLNKVTDYFNDQNPKYDKLVALVRRVIEYFGQNVSGVDEYTRKRLDTEA